MKKIEGNSIKVIFDFRKINLKLYLREAWKNVQYTKYPSAKPTFIFEVLAIFHLNSFVAQNRPYENKTYLYYYIILLYYNLYLPE